MRRFKLSTCLMVVVFGLWGCGAGDLGGDDMGDTDPGELDPLNPPEPPFPDNPFPDDGVCGDLNAVVNGLTPTVQLLIDQSGSMDADFAATDRWSAVYSTLMADDGVVQRLASAVSFGLSLYTSNGGDAGGVCPALTTVNPTLDNYAAMDAVFAPAGPEGDTPTGESIRAVAAQLAQIADPGPKIIVLGTDGEPDSCTDPNPSNAQAAAVVQAATVAAAQDAFSSGVRTFVISVGDDVGAEHLQDMANAGVGLAIDGTENADFYVALSPEDLINAFQQIVGNVTGCVFTIDGEVDPAKAVQGHVALDGQELDFGTDWRMLDGKTFEVLGSACEAIKDGDLHHVSAVFPCGVIVVN